MFNFYILKVSSILSKVFFLLLVIPSLIEGEYGEYYFLISVSLIFSRVISFANEEYIPSKLDEDNLPFFYVCYFMYVTVVVFFFILHITFDVSNFMVFVAASSIAANVTLGGILRLKSPLSHCFLANFPFVLFLFLSIGLGVKSSQELILVFSLSMLLSQMFFIKSFFLNTEALNFKNFKTFYFSKKSMKQWIGKVLSNILVIANLRVTILAVYILHGSNDDVAMALTIAEIFWQLVMVWLNRTYSDLMNKRPALLSYISFGKKFLLLLLIMLSTCLIAVQFIASSHFFDFLLRRLPLNLNNFSLYQSAILMSACFSLMSFSRIVIFSLEKFYKINPISLYFFQAFTFFVLLLSSLLLLGLKFSYITMFVIQGVIITFFVIVFLLYIHLRFKKCT